MSGATQARGRAARVGLVLAAALLVFAAYRFGVLAELGEPSRLAAAVRSYGAWSYLAFVVAYALLQPFGVPGTVFIVAAPLLWPWPVAFALSMVGTMAASVIGFSFSRFVARDWVSRRIPARFRRYDRALASRGFVTVLFLRFVFWMPPPLHAFFGVSRVPFWTHFWGSFAGYLVPLFLTAYFGERLVDGLRSASPATWAVLIGGTVVVLVGAWAVQKRLVPSVAAEASDADS